jgi:hypothetical protein
MDPIIINAELTLDDWRAYQRAAQARITRQPSPFALILPWVAASFAGLWIFDWFDIEFSLPSFIAGLLLLILLGLLIRQRSLKQYAPSENGAFLGSCTYTFNADGVRTQRASMGSVCAWRDVHTLTRDDQHLYIWIDTVSAFVLATRYLPPDLSATDLLEQLQQWRQAGEPAPHAAVSSAAAPGSAPRPHWTRTLLNLLLLRPVTAGDIPGTATPIALLTLTSLLLCLLLDRLSAGTQTQFYAHNLPVFGLYALVAVLIAWILSRDSTPSAPFGKLLFVVAGGLPISVLLLYAVSFFAEYPWSLVAYAAIGLYLLLYSARALLHLCNSQQPRAIVAASAVILLLVAANMANGWSTTLWYPREDESADAESDPTWTNSEALLFAQQQRIDLALDKVAATSPGKSSTYFLGFAGAGDQKVFAEEIALAAQVVNTRFGTQGRSLQLINDRRDLESQPLATVSNLRYALQGLAKKMNTDQDVLFLGLSSHGSNPPSLLVSNGFLSLQQVTGDNLAQALRDSGIKWRIIAISACHAGSFIESLKDPRTIIITAAAADKTSFGCADDRDLTYFGEAFYRDALPNAVSLEAAFAQARADLAAREQRENITASDPQAYFGVDITRKLAQ